MMEKRECQCVADRINTYLASQLWMDFELCVLNGSEIVLSGRLDELDEYLIDISFEQPCFISSRMFFTYEGGRFLKILEGEECAVISQKHQIEQGNFIFQFSADENMTPFFVAAEGIHVTIRSRPIRQ